MPNFRWTYDELEEISDKDFIRAILNERLSDLNPYSPLARKIKQVHSRLTDSIKKKYW